MVETGLYEIEILKKLEKIENKIDKVLESLKCDHSNAKYNPVEKVVQCKDCGTNCF